MEHSSFKRKSDVEDEVSRKAPRLGAGYGRGEGKDGGGGKGGEVKLSFAQRMMAKMGHKSGEGLGKSGDGILGAIEVKVRPQGVGLGAVREKTGQAKAEQKRQAEKRGEEYADSSEEERLVRKARKEAVVAKKGISGSVSSPAGGQRSKTRYRTAAEIEKEAEGLQVPTVLKSLIDATGKEAKLITSTAGLMTPTFTSAIEETEAQKIANRARKELESYALSWTELTERTRYIQNEETQLQHELDASDNELRHARQFVQAVGALQELDLGRPRLGDQAAQLWDQVTSEIESLHKDHANNSTKSGIADVAVACISPLFKLEMIDWEPLKNPTHLVSYFQRLQAILNNEKTKSTLVTLNVTDKFDDGRRQKATTSYESLIYLLWLPKVRTAITNAWNPLDPTPLLTLVEAWIHLLPTFVYATLVNELIPSKLSRAIQRWNPRVSLKSKNADELPHIWLFPWLQFLPPDQIDPSSSHGILADLKRKFRAVLNTWDLTRGVIPGLEIWAPVLGPTFQDALVKHLLPRLAQHLAQNFEVYPPEQDLALLENVFAWQGVFRPSVMGQLLIAEFFPKWLNTLHSWLTSDSVNYEEVGEWYSWWKTQIPANINTVKIVDEAWGKGLQMINEALELGSDRAGDLSLPAAGPSKPVALAAQVKQIATSFSPKAAAKVVEIDFKEIVEDWCAQENLLFMPLREAHELTGLPLFRITASAIGRGGVIVYLRGDIIWARRKGDKTGWDPAGLDDKLVARAEGK